MAKYGGSFDGIRAAVGGIVITTTRKTALPPLLTLSPPLRVECLAFFAIDRTAYIPLVCLAVQLQSGTRHVSGWCLKVSSSDRERSDQNETC